MFVTNRVCPQLYHVLEHDDGSVELVVSSKGTESVVTSQAAHIGSDVVANCILNYTKIKPCEGGCEWVTV